MLTGAAEMFRWSFRVVHPNSDGAGTVDQPVFGVSPDWLGHRVWLYKRPAWARVRHHPLNTSHSTLG